MCDRDNEIHACMQTPVRLGWPGRRAKASAGRRTVFPKCGAAFQGPGAIEGGRTKIEGGRTRIEGGAHKHRRGAQRLGMSL